MYMYICIYIYVHMCVYIILYTCNYLLFDTSPRDTEPARAAPAWPEPAPDATLRTRRTHRT